MLGGKLLLLLLLLSSSSELLQVPLLAWVCSACVCLASQMGVYSERGGTKYVHPRVAEHGLERLRRTCVGVRYGCVF
jgi:hypothetical protein